MENSDAESAELVKRLLEEAAKVQVAVEDIIKGGHRGEACFFFKTMRLALNDLYSFRHNGMVPDNILHVKRSVRCSVDDGASERRAWNVPAAQLRS